MKILMADKFYFIKGGAERYFFELAGLLTARGHEVIPFSMAHERNFPSPYSDCFVDYIDFNPVKTADKIRYGFQSFGRVIYSRQAQKRLSRLIERVRPDVAHLHMIDHQLSPSILPVLKQAGIPVIQTVHTYKHVCPSYRLYHMQKGTICEKCLHGNFYHPLVEKCHKSSFSASLLLVVEEAVHRLLKLYEKGVDIFHVPSRFMGAKLAEGGIDPVKIRHLFYTINLDDYPVRYDSDPYFVYFGRLSAEKGIMTLLKAVKGLKNIKLKIIGDGPLQQQLEDYAGRNQLEGVEFTGRMDGESLKKAVSGARFVVVPSEWYENSPLAIYESMAMGKPVIGSRMGGIPELIEHGRSGYLFKAGDSVELRHWICNAMDDASDRKKLPEMGRYARKKAETMFHHEVHYQKLMRMYDALMEKSLP